MCCDKSDGVIFFFLFPLFVFSFVRGVYERDSKEKGAPEEGTVFLRIQIL